MPNDIHNRMTGGIRRLSEILARHGLISWRKNPEQAPRAVASSGVRFVREDGTEVLDFLSGAFHGGLGDDPRIRRAIVEYIESSAPLYKPQPWVTNLQAELSAKMNEITPDGISSFFFPTGGTEAIGDAFQVAQNVTSRPYILALSPGYHGGFGLPLEASDNALARFLFERSGLVHHVDGPQKFSGSPEERGAASLADLERVLADVGPESVAAMVVEPVVGASGVYSLRAEYLREVQRILRKHGILLIFDEITSGFGRTGKMFALEHSGVIPDMLVVGKVLTGGVVPLYALCLSDELTEHFRKEYFPAGSTYNGWPLGCAIACAVIDIIREDRLVERVQELAPTFRRHFERIKQEHPCVRAFESIGLFGSLFLQSDSTGTPVKYGTPAHRAFMAELVERGLHVSHRHDGVLMIGPPLVITEADLAEGFAIIDAALPILDRVVE